MKILFVINSLKFGGAESLVFNFLKNAKKFQHDLDIEVCIFYEEGEWTQKLNDLKLIVHNIDAKMWNAFKITSQLYKIFKNKRYDIVHGHLWPTLYYLGFMQKLNKSAKFIFTEHNTWNKRRKHRILKKIESIFYSSYDSIIAISTETKSGLVKWQPQLEKKITILENGVTIPACSKTSYNLRKPISLLFVGRLVKQKGVDIAIKAIGGLTKKGFNLKLTIVGRGEEEQYLKELAQELPIDFLGARANISKIMNTHDIILIPSRWEGFGLVAIEAALVGIPIIASKVDALSRIIENEKSGLLFSPENINELQEKIICLIHSDALRQELANNAKKVAEDNWTMDKYIKNFLRFYENILDSQRDLSQS